MNCTNCSKINRLDSKFCRFCGTNFAMVASAPNMVSFSLSKLNNLSSILSKFLPDKKALLIIGTMIIFIAGGVFAAPKISGYMEVNGLIKKATEFGSQSNYKDSLAALILAEEKWTTKSKRQEISELKERQNRYITYQREFDIVLEKEKMGELAEAREILRGIQSDYPEYSMVQEKLNELQIAIENDLTERAKAKDSEARKARAVAAEAQQRAQEERAAKTKAEAERLSAEARARVATEEKQRADAQAAVAQAAAREAEYRQQQEALRRAEEVKRSFRSQLISAYNSYVDAASYYGSAIQYSNSGSSILALAQANSARAVLNTARDSISNLSSRFTGMPSDYYAAASNMVTAIDYLNRAIDLLVQSEGTSLDYSSSINSNKNLAVIYAARVESFIDSN